MGNFQSVTLDSSGISASNSTGDAPSQTNQGLLNDFGSTQPKNMRMTSIGDEVITEHITPSVIQTPTTSGLPGSLSTIQNSYGHPVGDVSTIKPKDTIQVAGTRCTIEAALQQGLLTRTAAGDYIETEALTKINAPYFNAPEFQSVSKMVDAEHQSNLDEMHRRVGQAHTSAFITQAISATLAGRPADTLVADFAQAIQADPNTIVPWINEYMTDLMESGVAQAAKLGKVDAGQLMEFVEGLDRSSQARLMIAAHHGDASALRWLLSQYKGR